MAISRVSVNRPVTIIMFFLAVILLGFISWNKLPQELFPSITYPQITVVTSYTNAAPEEIEGLITKVVEEAVGTVNNVKRISSISKEGLSMVMVEFRWGTNMDFAALNVREKIDLVKEKLPRECQEPIVMKYNPFDLPVLNLSVTGPAGMPSVELRTICKKYIKDAIEKVDNVAAATVNGGDEREILVEINQPRLRASQISIVSIVDSLRSTNINYPAGTIKESFYEYLIRTMGEYRKVAEIQDTPAAVEIPGEEAKTVKEKEKQEDKGHRKIIFLRDIASVKDSVKEKTSIARYNEKDSVSIIVRKQSGSNTLNVVKGVKKEIEKLNATKLPAGVRIQITYDQSEFIQESISNLRDAGIMGGILSLVVLLFFLWEIKSSLIITSAIPISITATATLMYFFGLDLNMMSLGGLAMGVGMVVDNANVVIENIFRHRQLGKEFKEAIIQGTQEMVSPIIGSTLTNIAVFLPFAFVVGIAGQIFKQLSFTISFSLISSIVVALSLVPVLVWIAGKSKRDEQIMRKVEENTLRYAGKFKTLLEAALARKGLVIGVTGILFLMSLGTLFTLNRQFLPKIDQRQFIIKLELEPGARLEITDRVVRTVERNLAKIPETKDVTINIGSSEEKVSAEQTAMQILGSHQAQMLVNLHKKDRRKGITRSTEAVIEYLKTNLEKENTERAQIEYLAQETSFGSALEQGAAIAIEVKGPDLNRLNDIAKALQSEMKKLDGVYGVKSSMSPPSPETKLNIMKDKASVFGLSVRDIAVTSQVALKGYVATKYKEKQGQEDIDIRVRLRPEDRRDINTLRRLLVHSPSMNSDIALSEVAFLTKGRGPTEIKRIDQQRSVMITGNSYRKDFNKVIESVNSIIASIKPRMGSDYSIELAGEQQKMQESFSSLAFALILAFALVYMIMAAEFESLWQPLLIMFTVPLSLIGVAWSLFITRTPLSVVSYLGIIMLGGIAVNNGIVLIEYVNALRKEGRSPEEAAIEASVTRLRPILMTSLTTILGLLPIAMGIGEGAELQAPLALTVMGGLISSTFLTLIFIPALYVVAENALGFFRKPQAEPVVEFTLPPSPKEAPEIISAVIAPAIQPATVTTPVTEEPAQPEVTAEAPRESTPPAVAVEIPSPTEPYVVSGAETISAAPQQEEEKKKKINSRQKELLVRLKELKKITRKDYALLVGTSIPTASRDLKELVDKGLLVPRGPFGPGRWYELKEES